MGAQQPNRAAISELVGPPGGEVPAWGGPVSARLFTGLLVPAGMDRPVNLCQVADSAAAISDAIGGHLLDDTFTVALPGAVPLGKVVSGGVLVGFYLAEDRAELVDNPRFAVLAARLGLHERGFQRGLRGDVLVLGCAADGLRDADVPPLVIQACSRCGLDDPAPASALAAVAADHAPARR